MTTVTVRMPVSEKAAATLVEAGVHTWTQDFAQVNAAREARAEELGISAHLHRDGVADTGTLLFDKQNLKGEIFSVRDLVKAMLPTAKVSVQKVEKPDKPAKYYLVVREIEVGFEEASALTEAAQSLITEISTETYRYLRVWSNPDASVTVNPSFAQRGNLVIKQLHFEAGQPKVAGY